MGQNMIVDGVVRESELLVEGLEEAEGMLLEVDEVDQLLFLPGGVGHSLQVGLLLGETFL